MKKSIILFSICFVLMLQGMIFAQADNNIPYLSDKDVIAIETVLPDDSSFNLQEDSASSAEEKLSNEMSRLNTSQPVYHLLVLDRVYCPGLDISDIGSMQILYKYRHGQNGYLIALYVSPLDGPVFPQLPARSRIVLNLSTVRSATIGEYINSNAFRRFVTSRTITTGLQEALWKLRR